MRARALLALALSLPAAAAMDLELTQPTVSSGGGRCEDDWHCSLGGECTAGQCVCDHWTTGAQCNLLNLAHLERDVSSYGLQMPAYHSCKCARTTRCSCSCRQDAQRCAVLSQSGCWVPSECRGRPCGGRRERGVEWFLFVHVQSPHAWLMDHCLLNRPSHRQIDRWAVHCPADGRAGPCATCSPQSFCPYTPNTSACSPGRTTPSCHRSRGRRSGCSFTSALRSLRRPAGPLASSPIPPHTSLSPRPPHRPARGARAISPSDLPNLCSDHGNRCPTTHAV